MEKEAPLYPGQRERERIPTREIWTKLGTSVMFISVKAYTGYHAEQSGQFYPGEWESGRLLDLKLQGKNNLITKRSWKMLATVTGKTEVTFLGDEIFVDLNLLC